MLLDKSGKLPANFLTIHKSDLKHTLIIGSTRDGMSNPFNSLSNTKGGVDSTMALLVQMSGGQVEECVETKAREVLLAESANKANLSLLDIVEAFEQVPVLQKFAGRLRHYTLPAQ